MKHLKTDSCPNKCGQTVTYDLVVSQTIYTVVLLNASKVGLLNRKIATNGMQSYIFTMHVVMICPLHHVPPIYFFFSPWPFSTLERGEARYYCALDERNDVLNAKLLGIISRPPPFGDGVQ